MSKICTRIDELIGNTPLLRLSRIEEHFGLKATLLAKVEGMNPAGSIKDRAAKKMLDEGERLGLITKNTVIIEPTSGNTGIGLASIGASRGYKVIIVMPDSMSIERQMLMRAYGAELVLTPGKEGMSGAIKKANELKNSLPDAFVAGQFENPANALAHYLTTGPEIWQDTDGNLDLLICGVGTGGTISGTGRYLKEQKPDLKIVAVEPADSPVLSGGSAGSHALQGIGAGFIPKLLDTSIYDRVCKASTEDAYTLCRLLGQKEGLLVGISSGAALSVAVKQAALKENEGKTLVVILPDTGDRYLSTPLFSE